MTRYNNVIYNSSHGVFIPPFSPAFFSLIRIESEFNRLIPFKSYNQWFSYKSKKE